MFFCVFSLFFYLFLYLFFFSTLPLPDPPYIFPSVSSFSPYSHSYASFSPIYVVFLTRLKPLFPPLSTLSHINIASSCRSVNIQFVTSQASNHRGTGWYNLQDKETRNSSKRTMLRISEKMMLCTSTSTTFWWSHSKEL